MTVREFFLKHKGMLNMSAFAKNNRIDKSQFYNWVNDKAARMTHDHNHEDIENELKKLRDDLNKIDL